jgi:hypothetical protein
MSWLIIPTVAIVATIAGVVFFRLAFDGFAWAIDRLPPGGDDHDATYF